MLELIGCTEEELRANPSLVDNVRSNAEAAALAPFLGRSGLIDSILERYTVGRSFFFSVGGRIGVTGTEKLTKMEGESQPDFDKSNNQRYSPVLGPMASSEMYQSMQIFAARNEGERDRMVEQFIGGTLPGQRPRGMINGDLIVALVGGFEPFVLRPTKLREHGVHGFDEDGGKVSQDWIRAGEEYRIVGTRYLDGAMNGEMLKKKNWLGRDVWRKHAELQSIVIV